MLKVRVIPTLLWKNFGLVKGVGFDSWRRVGPVLPAIKVYNQREVDELILVDIISHQNKEELDLESIKDFSRECYVPFTVGGGIRNTKQVQYLLRSGADKISINTVAYHTPSIVDDIAKRHGSQCVVSSIDVRKNEDSAKWICYSNAGQVCQNYEVREWAKKMEDYGAGEILITSINLDGTMKGYDLDLIEEVTKSVDVPVIASGGAGNYKHMVDAITKAGASAVAAASMFHFTEQTPAGAKEALADAGLPVRRPYVPV